jgi:hypothetical protein
MLTMVAVADATAKGGRAAYRDFTLDYGARMQGGEYRFVSLRSLRRCAQICKEQALCRAFSYQRYWGGCSLLARISTSRRRGYGGYITGVKVGAPVGRGGIDAATRVGQIVLEYGVERIGKGYLQVYRDDSEACARECDRRPRCLSFRYRPWSRACALFDELVGKRPGPGAVSGVRRPVGTRFRIGANVDAGEGAGVSEESGVAFGERDGFSLYRDLALYGREYRRLPATEQSLCLNECRTDPACRSFSYHPDTSQCYLKSLATPRRYRKGVISGFRQ